MLHDLKGQDKNLNILRTKRDFEPFFTIFKGYSVSKSCPRPESMPLITYFLKIELKDQIKEYTCKFTLDKITYSNS